MDQIKTISVTATRENPQVTVRNDWHGYVVVSTETPNRPMRVDRPKTVVIPMLEPKGPTTREKEVEALRAKFEKPSDVYVICCVTPAGVERQGMIAVPRAIYPGVAVR